MADDSDPELDDTAPSRRTRSSIRNEGIAYAKFAEHLVRGKRVELPMPPFDTDIRDALIESRRLAKSARSRQIRRLAGLLRGAGTVEELREALEGRTASAAVEQARERGNEAWRTRLIEEGDAALTQLIAAHPGAERTRLRQLTRQAKRTPPDARSKRAATALLRLIRETRAMSPRAVHEEAEPEVAPAVDEVAEAAAPEAEPG